jgi:hypothetical protein
MKLILIFLLLIVLSSCGLWREDSSSESKTQEIAVNDIELVGDVAGMPVNLNLKHKGTKETQQTTQETKESSSPAGESIIGYLVTLMLGGGVAGFAIKKLKDGTIKRIVNGIESFKQEAPAETTEALHSHLSKKLDSGDKSLVKKLK